MKYQTFLTLLGLLLFTKDILGQSSVTPNTWNTSIDYLGWDMTSNCPDLFIKNEQNQPIHFYTNAGGGTFNNERMIIDADPGYVGIGSAAIPPGFRLDVDGEVNIASPAFSGGVPCRGSYMLGGNTVLASFSGNLIAGIGAGVNMSPGNTACTFIGENAGSQITSSGGNTFVGWQSGEFAMGAENTFLGAGSGRLAGAGNNYSYIGYKAGISTSNGSGNTFIGFEAGSDSPAVSQAVAIGAHARVNCSNCTVLGGDRVGINTDSPQAALDVNGVLQAKQIFITDGTNKQDLLLLINQLKAEVERLKEKQLTSHEN